MGSGTCTRRLAVLSAAIVGISGHVWAAPQQEPIRLDLEGIKDVRGLVAEMKKKAGPLFPSNVKAEALYRDILNAAISNARRAADMGIKVPQAILKMAEKQAEKWHMTKVQVPPMIIFPVLGVFFAMPLGAFFVIVLASMWILIVVAGSNSKKEEIPPIQKQNGHELGGPSKVTT